MAAEVGPLLLLGNDESLDEDDLERQEELHRLLQDLPEDLLEDSGTDTEQDEDGEERASMVSCSPPEGDTAVGDNMWYGSESANRERQEGVVAGVPPLHAEECDQGLQLEPWSAESHVGVAHAPTGPVCAHEQVRALESELQSLTVLYHTQGKKVDQLSSALEAAVAERERCERMQSHRRDELEAQCAGLGKELDRLKVSAARMAEEKTLLSRQLEEVQQAAVLMEEDRNEMQRQLQSAESAVSSLQRQLEEVVGGDTLRQLRDHYEATLAAASERHSAAVLRLQQELDRLKGGAELQEGVGKEVEGRGPSMPPSFLVGPPSAEGDNYRHLVAECEDLRSTMSRAAEEREALSGELEDARTAGLRQQSLVSQLEVEACGLRKELASVEGRWREEEGRWREERLKMEKEKKAALEECRSQCLQLHDQSASRLNKAFEAEKRFLLDNCQRQTDALRAELEAVQEKCSSLSAQLAGRQDIPQQSCCETDALHLSGLVDEAELESRVEAELEAARVVWRDSLLDSTESAVSKALQKVEVEFTRRLERERVAVEERVRSDWAKDKQQALAQLAEELAAGPGRQAGLSVAVQTAESWEGSMGEAVRQAREQWEEGRGREEAALRVELERRHELDLKEAVQRVLERAKAHYEGVVAHVRSKLVAEQCRAADQQAAEREALRRQLGEVEEELRQEQLWRREIEMVVYNLQLSLRRDLAAWMVQVLGSRR